VRPIIVGISEFRFAEFPQMLVTYGLGSCVAVIIYSKEANVAAMSHIMLPMAFNQKDHLTPGKFADTAIASMVSEMSLRGIMPYKLVAKMAGGADMFAGRFKGGGGLIGARNIMSVHKTLDSRGIPLLTQDVGGMVGRTAEFSTVTGLLTVRTLRGEIRHI
jgi:chemotaxis protein CheD